MKTCTHCGSENQDTSALCVCGQPLSQDTAPAPATATVAETSSSAATKEPRLILRKVLFVLGTLALIAVYGLYRHRVGTNPLYSSLVVTGVWGVLAVAGLWFLGREKRPMLRAWRIALLVRAVYLLPLLLNILDGLVEHGWPTGRFNRPIANILTFIIPLAALGFLTGLIMQIRTYRVAGAFAFLSGIASVVLGVYLIPVTKSIRALSITPGDVLNNVMLETKYESYATIPLAVVFIVAGVLILWAARTRTRA